MFKAEYCRSGFAKMILTFQWRVVLKKWHLITQASMALKILLGLQLRRNVNYTYTYTLFSINNLCSLL